MELDVDVLLSDNVAEQSRAGRSRYTGNPNRTMFARGCVWRRLMLLFEATSLSPRDGQPAIDHIRAALEAGAHAITANKGPIVHAYEELTSLATAKGRSFLFESTVMDGVPIFALFRDNLAGHSSAWFPRHSELHYQCHSQRNGRGSEF